MKKVLLFLGLSLAMPVLSLSPVFAVAATANTTNSTTAATTAEPAPTTDTATKLAELKKRIEANKATLKAKLDAATTKRIIAKCKASQVVVETHGKAFAAVGEGRVTAYTQIMLNLHKLADRLKADGKDTTQLEADLKDADLKVASLKDGFTQYQQTISDLKELDCVADPTAYQATLVAARTGREGIRGFANDLHTFLLGTIKEDLAKLRPQDAADKKTTTNPANSDTVLTGQKPLSGGTN